MRTHEKAQAAPAGVSKGEGRVSTPRARTYTISILLFVCVTVCLPCSMVCGTSREGQRKGLRVGEFEALRSELWRV